MGATMVSDFGKRVERGDESSSSPEPVESSEDAEVSLDPRLDRLIGTSLQAHYDDIVAAPLPDTILVLLAQLDAKEKNA